MNHAEDISIGQGKWIHWIGFDAQAVKPMDLDPILEPTLELWENLEVDCLSACCGLNAFSFWEDDILHAQSQTGNPNLKHNLDETIRKIELMEVEVLVSSRLNQLIHKQVFLQLLEHLFMTLKPAEGEVKSDSENLG
ncbi:hypothetical protein KFE98_02750 [bacterium SCSIO 12741]|nr:hypothetical protein KFE98_02750 [bacterium SCSIO 12741]